MRNVIFITSSNCAMCNYIKTSIIPVVKAEFPGQVQVIDPTNDPENICKRFRVSHVPTILLVDEDKLIKKYDKKYMPRAMVLIGWLEGRSAW